MTLRRDLSPGDRANDSLFQARAALKRAIGVRASVDAQVDELRALVHHLAAERRDGT